MTNPVSPYIVGQVLKQDANFFGRLEIVEWVEQRLRNPTINSLVLFGQRRIGKSSLLRHLERVMPSRLFLPIYFDLAEQTTKPLDIVLTQLIKEIIKKQACLKMPDSSELDDQGQFFQHVFLPRFYKELGEHCRPVFLLDEFDALDEKHQQALEPNAAAKSLFPFIRRIMTEDELPVFIFVIGRQPDDLSVDIKATFKASLKKEVWVLERDDAEKLILQARDNNTLNFKEDAIERILTLTSCHPYLTQLICYIIWEQAYEKMPDKPPLISEKEVETALPVALDEGDNVLVWLWDGLSLAEKIYAAALAQIAGEGDLITKDQVMEVLKNHAARLHISELDSAARDLVERRVLNRIKGDYRFAVEMFRRWVNQRKPLDDIKDELDHAEPEADRFHKSGSTFANLREWQNAISQFEKALEINPRHFKARLYMGEALLELNQIDEAVTTLEQAYELERSDSAYLLAHALEARVKAGEKEQDEDDVLATCERILTIYPKNEFAQEKKTAIWTDQLSRLEKEAHSYMQNERWNQAAGIYEQLTNQAIDEESRAIWQKALHKCKLESKLSQDFDDGLKAKDQGEWQKAKTAFLKVITHVITYQKNGIWATELLDQLAKKSPKPFLPHPLPFFKPNQIISVENVSNIKQVAHLDELRDIKSAVYAANGEFLAVTSLHGVYLLDSLTLTRTGFIKTDSWVECIAFSPDGKISAFGMRDGTIQLVHIKDGNLCHPPLKKHSRTVNSVVFSPDGRTLISGGADPPVCWWQVATGALQDTLEEDIEEVWAVAFSTDGKILASASTDGIIRLWQVYDMRLLHTLTGHSRFHVWEICFSPDGATLASASSDNTIRLWDTSSGNSLLTLKAKNKAVTSIAYSPNEMILVSGSKDKTLRLWKADDGELLHIIDDFSGDVTSVTFAPDGTAIVSVNNRIVQLWGAI